MPDAPSSSPAPAPGSGAPPRTGERAGLADQRLLTPEPGPAAGFLARAADDSGPAEFRALRLLPLVGALALAATVAALVALAWRAIPGRPPGDAGAARAAGGPLHREAVSAARGFLEAASAGERIARVRHAETLGPLIEARWARGLAPPPDRWRDLIAIDRDPGLAAAEAAFFARDADERLHLVNLVREDGELRIDWESFAAHHPVPVDTFFAAAASGDRPVSAPFRVAAERGDYHNFGFADAAAWTSWRLRFRETERVVHGFSRAGSPVDRALADAVGTRAHVRVTVQLRLEPAHAEHGLVEITALVSPGWVTARPLVAPRR